MTEQLLPPTAGTRADDADAARERATRSMFGLSELFHERPELRGVHAPADLTEDAIRWSA